MPTVISESLQNLIDNLPTSPITLYTSQKNKTTGEKEYTFSDKGDYPISDHEVLLAASPVGLIGSWNVYNPNSRTGPTFCKNYFENGHHIPDKDEQKAQCIAKARHIVDLFANGVELFCFQEVPKMDGELFPLFLQQLIESAQEKNITFDIEAFKNSFRLNQEPVYTAGAAATFHDFGTAVLFRQGAYQIDSLQEVLDGRGSLMVVTNCSTGSTFNLLNHHGDYVYSQTAVATFEKLLNKPSTMICSDTNIPVEYTLSDPAHELPKTEETNQRLSGLPGIITDVKPSSEQVARHKITPECILSNMPGTTYVCKKGLSNRSIGTITDVAITNQSSVHGMFGRSDTDTNTGTTKFSARC